MPFATMSNRPELCRSLKSVSLKAPMKFCAAPDPRKSGTAILGLCGLTSLMITELSCATSAAMMPNKMVEIAMGNDFFVIVLAQTRTLWKRHFQESRQEAAE